jgi:polyisoprenoid-binding protein YceI
MTIRFVSALALAAALGGAAWAQSPPSQDPAQVEAGAYAIEPIHTRIMFSVDHFGTSTYFGGFSASSGTLILDPKNLGATKGEIRVSTASIATANPKLDSDLKSERWFDAARYPQMVFRITKVTPTGERQANVDGDFTLHGVTRPLTLAATLHGAGPHPFNHKFTAGFDLTGKINRSDFGMKTMAPLMGDEVNLTISAVFEKQG